MYAQLLTNSEFRWKSRDQWTPRETNSANLDSMSTSERELPLTRVKIAERIARTKDMHLADDACVRAEHARARASGKL